MDCEICSNFDLQRKELQSQARDIKKAKNKDSMLAVQKALIDIDLEEAKHQREAHQSGIGDGQKKK
jgi:hypothetical protein